MVLVEVFKGSLIYRLFFWIYSCYQNSLLRRILQGLANACRNSFPAKLLKSSAERKSALEYSFFSRIVKAIFKPLDRWVLWFSKSLEKWSETSLLVCTSRVVIKQSRKKLFALVFPVFGAGYLAGRVFRGALMIRDVLLLGILFIVAAIWLWDCEQRKTVFKNSLVYQLYVLLLE